MRDIKEIYADIPHIEDISQHGVYQSKRTKATETFAVRTQARNKVAADLKEAIRNSGLRDGMTI